MEEVLRRVGRSAHAHLQGAARRLAQVGAVCLAHLAVAEYRRPRLSILRDLYLDRDLPSAVHAGGVVLDHDAAHVRWAGQYAGSDVKFVHRSVGDAQIYWLDSRSGKAEDILISLKTAGMEPEIWNAVTGEVSKPSYRIEDGRTLLTLHFDPWDALFVVLRRPAAQPSYEAPVRRTVSSRPVEGAWSVAFPAGMGAPSQTTFPVLSDWSVNADAGIRYYSGTAVYTKTLELAPARPGEKLMLDLGDVQNIAEVSVNGKSCGLVWKTPFRFDITDAVQAGENRLEVRITNMWVNRLIGDVQPGAKQYARTSQQSYRPDAPLRPSGLLGPVTVQIEQ